MFSSVLSFRDTPSQRPEPTRVWSSHSLPVTDLYVGHGGYTCRVVSASLDQTCRVCDIGLLFVKTLIFSLKDNNFLSQTFTCISNKGGKTELTTMYYFKYLNLINVVL